MVGFGTLCDGDKQRLDGHMMQAVKHNMCDDTFQKWFVRFAIVDVNNTEIYQGKAHTEIAPTLLTKSKLWNLVEDAGIPLSVHWLMQGFPHPMATTVPAAIRDRCPFPALLQQGTDSGTDMSTSRGRASSSAAGEKACLTLSQERRLVGNAMNIAQVSAVLLHCIASTILTG